MGVYHKSLFCLELSLQTEILFIAKMGGVRFLEIPQKVPQQRIAPKKNPLKQKKETN